MIHDIVDALQKRCNETANATAEQVGEWMRAQGIHVQTKTFEDDKPVVGMKFYVQDTERTVTSPDGHFSSHTLTATPSTDGGVRRWHIRVDKS